MSVRPKIQNVLTSFIGVLILLCVAGCRQKITLQPTPTSSAVVLDVSTRTLDPPTPTVTVVPVATLLPTATITPDEPEITITPSPKMILSPEPTTYVVQAGDTLSGIALVYSITLEELMAANGLDSDLIYADQKLIIPRQTVQPVPTTMSTPAVVTTPISVTVPRLPPIEATFITNGDRSKPYIALTFDACQTASNPAGYDQAIIRVLTETQTPATLFLGGLWMQSHSAQTQMLASNPLFELGNHSWSHLDFAEITREEMRAEILLTQDIMYTLTGRQPTLFRLPFGTYTDETLQVIAEHGLRTIQWDVVTGDPDPNISAEAIVNVVTANAQNGSIVIMHMNTRGWHTAEALPELIGKLREQGYVFVTVSKLLGLVP